MLIINICCAYNISMSLAKFSMTVNRILHIFVSKKGFRCILFTGILLFMDHSLIIIH